MSKRDKDLINKIEQLENQLRDLRLELQRGSPRTPNHLQVGDKVVIKNPSRGQPDTGTLIKIHPTKRGTVLAIGPKNRETKIIRLLKNLEKVQNDD